MYKSTQVQNYKLEAVQKIQLFNQAADNFASAGFVICLASWLWVNVLAVKTRQALWVWLPFLYTVFVSWQTSYQEESIFIFNKQNGMWKGGFSLSFFFGVAIIFFSLIVLVINYLILTSLQKNKKNI